MGTTTVSWDTGDGEVGEVYASRDGAPEVLFAGGVEGSQEAPSIIMGSTYEFRLYAGTESTPLLATVVVTPGEI